MLKSIFNYSLRLLFYIKNLKLYIINRKQNNFSYAFVNTGKSQHAIINNGLYMLRDEEDNTKKNKISDSSKKSYDSRESDLNDLDIRLREIKRKAKENSKKISIIDRNSINNTSITKEEYARFTKREKDNGVVSRPLLIIGLVLGLAILIMLVSGYYVNSANPLISVVREAQKSFVINILDRNNVRIFGLVSNKSTRKAEATAEKSAIPYNLSVTLMALHTILEKRLRSDYIQYSANDPVEEDTVNNGINITEPPIINPVSFDLKNKSEHNNFRANILRIADQVEIVPSTPKTGNNLPSSPNNNSNVIGYTDITSTDETSSEEDVLTENAKSGLQRYKEIFFDGGCEANGSEEEFSSYNCRYSYPNFLINDFVKPSPDDSIFVKTIAISSTVKKYLLIRWIEENLTSDIFMQLLFNSAYYGNNLVGLEVASSNYFNKTINDLSIEEATFLVKQMYDNNKNLYPEEPVYIGEIVKQLVQNKEIRVSDYADVLNRANAIKLSDEKSSFAVYLDDIFLKAYSYAKQYSIVNVNTTLISPVQNTTISLVVDAMKKNAIPDVSVIIINNSNVVSGFNMNLSDAGNRTFSKNYPNISVSNSIKPFMYLSLLENKVEVSQTLLENKYQNLIFSYQRIMHNTSNKANITTNSLPAEPIIEQKVLEAITKTNLDVSPEEIRLLFARQLYDLESTFFNKNSVEQYKNTFMKFYLPVNFTSVDDLVSGNARVQFLDLAKLYNTLSQGGNLYNLRYIAKINSEVMPDDFSQISNINARFINIMQSMYFEPIIIKGSKKAFFSITDFNVGFAYSNDYTLAIWLGDLSNDKNNKDYSVLISQLINQITPLLQ